jgi:hypothetical protein
MKYLLFCLITHFLSAQILHHQMFSSQGKNSITSNGVYVNHSIGQQSPGGTFNTSSLIVQQGFQQNMLLKYGSIPINSNNAITTVVYPNPFVNEVNFQFSSEVKGPFSISIFDMMGKLILTEEKEALQNILTVESLGHLASGQYIVNLRAQNYNYGTKIIKNNK